MIYGDSYLPCDYAAAEHAFDASGKLGLMTVYRNEGQWDTSNVEFDGAIIAYDKQIKTPRMQFIDYGLGAFKASGFRRLPVDAPCDLAPFYQDLLARGELAAYEVAERFYEIGSVDGLNELSRYLASQGSEGVMSDTK